MENLKYIEAELKGLQAEINAYGISSDDIRTSYLELTFSVLDLYYRQWISITAARIIKEKYVELSQDELSVFEAFVGSVTDITTFYSVRNSSFRNLLIDSWSTFEFCLTYLCVSLFDEKATEDLLEEDFRKISIILSKYDVANDDRKKILRKYSTDHFTHLSVNRKYEKIYSIYKKRYNGDWSEDSKFLSFYGKYRNCMHTNYIYHGQDAEYTFDGVQYRFINGEAVDHSKEPDIKEMFNLTMRLKSTCKRLFDAIEHPGLLPFPSDKVFQP